MRRTSEGDRNGDSSRGNGSSSVYRALRDKISALDFQAFQILVVLWLGAKGYSHMSSLGRRHARGRREQGGADFTVQLPHSDNVRVAVQVRHWRTPIQRRAVDEMAGYLRRNGIERGLIVTNSSFFSRAIRAAQELPGQPVRLVSGAKLAGSLAALGLGVDEAFVGLDPKFFRSLDGLSLGTNLGIRSAVAKRGIGGINNLDPGPLWLLYLIGAIGTFLSWLWTALHLRRQR